MGVTPVELEDEDVVDELPLATTSSRGWSRRDGGTGGGWGRREEMPRDMRGRVGRWGGVAGGSSELDAEDSCEVMVGRV